MITLILATDMARHGEILNNFKSKIDGFDFTNDEHLTSVGLCLVNMECCVVFGANGSVAARNQRLI